jgi:hypothetical protein
MKERGMLFSKLMVLALLGGSKTQTRRISKQHQSGGRRYFRDADRTMPRTDLISPYGQPGDRLWVRETWQGPILECDEHFDQWRESPDMFKKPGFCVYRATDTLDAIDDDGKELGWRPSIHMPRWASRIDLEITSVRVERLQKISEEDAVAEGIGGDFANYTSFQPNVSSFAFAKDSYRSLWESINGPGSWDENPWVWVLEFRRVKP